MAGTLPTVRGGVQALTPLVRSVQFLTDIAFNLNATEQRFKRRPPLTKFTLVYNRMSAFDTNAMRAFFESQKGAFDSTWTFTLGSITYSALTFEDTEFRFTEDAATPTLYSFTLKCRQTKNPAQTAGAAGANFPTLASGATALLPYVQARRFAVLLNDNATGMRYSYVWLGLAGFPARSLRGWELDYSVLTDADLATLEAHFRNNWGRWSTFQWTDPDDSTVYPKCRYDSDSLDVTHHAPNYSSLKLRILETN